MKASHVRPDLRITAALGPIALLAACVPASAPPTPLPAPQPAPAPAPARPAPPAPPAANWADEPQTPGTWRYGAQGGYTEAAFIGPANQAFARLRCMTANRMVVLSLPESGAARPRVTIRSHTATRTLEGQPAGRETQVPLAANDSLLDAMAFARGRFAIEAEGLPPLYLPSWPEVARVIEDCR
ncbi:MAG: hypothetical protein ACK4IS_03865 [Erythrobacter sp.]